MKFVMGSPVPARTEVPRSIDDILDVFDLPAISDVNAFVDSVVTKLNQSVLEATSQLAAGGPKPHVTVRVYGYYLLGDAVIRVAFGTDAVPSREELFGERLGGIIGDFDPRGGAVYVDEARRNAARVVFDETVRRLTVEAGGAGTVTVIPVWLSDPKP